MLNLKLTTKHGALLRLSLHSLKTVDHRIQSESATLPCVREHGDQNA